MIIKRRYWILMALSLFVVGVYFVDRKVCMKNRVTSHHLWEHIEGDMIRGDFIFMSEHVSFYKDTMVLEYWKRGLDTIIHKNMTATGTVEKTVIRFKTDTTIIDYRNKENDTLILKYQYFKTIKVMDPKTSKIGIYRMKGSK